MIDSVARLAAMAESTPICRCRVLYLGSSVPQQTKDGLQGIQEPLQELYPDQGATGARGIDSWLSVWSNGILLENVDENHKKITRFFPIESLHYCAAVRYVLVPEKSTSLSSKPTPRFLPLDSPFARTPNPAHPPLFAAILRRTTGIKVLECHAFICKREVAANALVRCCFHAYADSSYAKQVDTAGSIYGTLASTRQDKVADWKTMNQSTSGSTMTLNTVVNNNTNTATTSNGNNDDSNDDVSIYNGDENHKVWAGSQDNLDAIYDVYSSSTITRPSRPRQISQPMALVPPPPPPPVVTNKESNNIKKTNKKAQQHQRMSKEELYSPHHVVARQQPVYIVAAPPPPPHHLIHQQTLPNPKMFFKQGGGHNTFSHRPRGRGNWAAPRSIAPPLVPVILPPPQSTTATNKGRRSRQHAMEEPIYMPSNRALSPVASYQPISFPHEAYLMQHYATMEGGNHHHHHNSGKQQPQQHQQKRRGHKMMMNNKKIQAAQSMNGLDDPHLSANGNVSGGDDTSPFNTGIYRKKGHMNERAFSYSIRQEHRSRSYGSLANLKFATPMPPNEDDGDQREDFKKEREIMQLVQDLDLSGDELERSEVPRGMYEGVAPPRMGGAPVMIAPPGSHHQMMRNGRR